VEQETGVTTELTYLAATLALALIQILLPAFARTREFGLSWNAGARDNTPEAHSPVVGRLERAQANLFETLPLFIGAVLIAQVADQTGAPTAWGAALYFWARVAYIPLYALGVPYIRSLVWLVSLAGLAMCLLALFIRV
jgi:uncharacterized MAPEG superfamily protein